MYTTQDIYVQYLCGAYVTATVRGERTSCTGSAAQAAEKQAQKLFGPALVDVVQVQDGNQYTQLFRATADDEAWASCRDDGTIVYASVIPPANTGIARGPLRALQLVVGNLASVTSGAGPVRVAGMVAGASRQANDEALARWLKLGAARNGKKGSLGVTFSTTVVRAAL